MGYCSLSGNSRLPIWWTNHLGRWVGIPRGGVHPHREESNERIRAEKLDESLAIIEGLWQGTPLSFSGKHYELGPLEILPTPLQRPRVPIWTAAGWPRQRPLKRAARFDGVYLMTLNRVTRQMLQPRDVTAVATYIAEHRSSSAPLDIALNGDVSGDPDPEGTIADFEQAGTTW